jgi:hypothetical protein
MDGPAIEYLGWLATAVFVGSYFCAHPDTLKRVQMVGALMWVAYGLLIGASPVVAANLLVFGAAAWATTRAGRAGIGTAERGASVPELH